MVHRKMVEISSPSWSIYLLTPGSNPCAPTELTVITVFPVLFRTSGRKACVTRNSPLQRVPSALYMHTFRG